MFIGLVCCCCGFAYSFAALVLIFYFFEFSSYIYIYVAFCFFWSYSCRISLNKTLPAATPLPSRTGDELVVEFNSCSSTPVSYNLCHDPHLEPRKAVGGCRLHKTLSSEQKATATKKIESKKKLNKMPSKVPTLSTWLLKCIQPKSKNYKTKKRPRRGSCSCSCSSC